METENKPESKPESKPETGRAKIPVQCVVMPKIYDYSEISSLPKEWVSVDVALPPIGTDNVPVYPPRDLTRERGNGTEFKN